MKMEHVDTLFFCSSGGTEEAQQRHWEANAFAADILMPKDEIVKQIANGNNNLVSLAETFSVTPVVNALAARTHRIMG